MYFISTYCYNAIYLGTISSAILVSIHMPYWSTFAMHQPAAEVACNVHFQKIKKRARGHARLHETTQRRTSPATQLREGAHD